MTDRRPRPRPRPRAARRNALAVYATSAALFASVFGFLGLRVAHGQDPSLGQLTAQVGSASREAGPSTAPLRTSTSGSAGSVSSPVPATPGGTPTSGVSRHDD